MTAGQVIRRFDDLRRNSLPLEVKLGCIAQLEKNIAADFGLPKPEKVAEDTVLLAPDHGQLYYLQLCARLDFENGDFERQRNDLKLFAERYAEFAAGVVRSRNRGGRLKVGGV